MFGNEKPFASRRVQCRRCVEHVLPIGRGGPSRTCTMSTGR
jgi:hypothetical protein